MVKGGSDNRKPRQRRTKKVRFHGNRYTKSLHDSVVKDVVKKLIDDVIDSEKTTITPSNESFLEDVIFETTGIASPVNISVTERKLGNSMMEDESITSSSFINPLLQTGNRYGYFE